jgi:hypothetical protein
LLKLYRWAVTHDKNVHCRPIYMSFLLFIPLNSHSSHIREAYAPVLQTVDMIEGSVTNGGRILKQISVHGGKSFIGVEEKNVIVSGIELGSPI